MPVTTAISSDFAVTGRVVVVSHGFQKNYERGFCNGLAALGLKPILISSNDTDYAGLSADVATVNLRGAQDSTRGLLVKIADMLAYQWRLLRWTVVRKPSIVHVVGLTQPPLLMGIADGLIFRAFSGRYVLTIHNLLPHDRRSFWLKGMFRLTYAIAHNLVVHTRLMKDKLITDFGIRSERIAVMEHGIEPIEEMPVVRPTARIEDERPCLLLFGSLSPYKGIDLLFDALDLLPTPVRLVVAGSGRNNDFIAAIQARASRVRAVHDLRWDIRFIPESEMPALFLAADILVLPYKDIDQSGVLFQALRFGVPVVATRVGSMAHYIAPEIGELSDPGDARAFCEALQRMINRLPALNRDAIVAHARQYEWSTTTRALLPVYGARDSH